MESCFRRDMNVTVYTSPTCGYCHQAKAYLSGKGVPYKEKDVSVDRAAADEMMRLTGQMGVPVIVVDGQAVVGFNRVRLDQLLAGGTGSGKVRFGLKVADASRMVQRAGSLPVSGAFVGQAAPGSPGQRAGLLPGDIITEVNMRPISSAIELEKALWSIKSGSNVSIVFIRGSDSLRTEVRV